MSAPVTSLYTGIFVIFYLLLTYYVILGRWKYRVALGDKDNTHMRKRIRTHGNFYEYVPLVLICLLLLEIQNASTTLLHTIALLLLISRISHSVGLKISSGTSSYRACGSAGTHLALIISAFYLIKIYFVN